MEDLTDNEAEEQLRRWWRENWLWIVGGVAVGLALLWGWQYWKDSKLAAAQQQESAYRGELESLARNQFDQAVSQAKMLRDRNPGSPYADQADLALARAALEEGKLDVAASHLKTVADSSKDAELRSIARTRLARVMIEQGKYDEAIALLDTGSAGSFLALYHDVRGDAYAGKGDAASARREYESALSAAKDGVDVDRGWIELKRDALPAQPAAGAAGK